MTTGTPAVKDDREPKSEDARPPQLTKEVIEQANLTGVDELTTKITPAKSAGWWSQFSQHTLSHLTAGIVLAALALAFNTLIQRHAKTVPAAIECDNPQRPFLHADLLNLR